MSKRIREAERRLQVGAIVVPLQNGGRVHVRECDVLDVLLTSFRRTYARIEGDAAPSSRFDRELDLLGNAVADPTADPVILLTIETLQQQIEPTSETTTIN
jgi:hypothetical protein